MAITFSVNDYLISHQLPFKLVSHPDLETVVLSTINTGTPQRKIAKVVLLEGY